MDNAVLQTIRARRSVRRYTDDPVPQEMLDAIVEAGRWAPSGGNNQSARFLVIKSPEVLKELKALAREEFRRMDITPDTYASIKSSILQSKRGGYDFTYGGAVLILVANRRGYGNAMADSAAAIENMLLAAASLGVGACWINQIRWLADHPAVVDKLASLGIPPEEMVCGGVSLGMPAGEPPRAPERKGNPVIVID